MPLTVAQVLNLEILSSSQLLVGQDLIDDRIVQWVSVIEAPVAAFVRPNELVISTAMGIGHDSALLVEFIEQIAASGAAALAIATGPYAPVIPPSALAAAAAANIPLIEIRPWELRFSEISEAIILRLVDEQQSFLRESFSVYQQFTGLIQAGGDLPDLAQALFNRLHCPVIVLDILGYALARAGVAGSDLVSRARMALADLGGGRADDLPSARAAPDIMLVPVRAAHRVCGYLAVGNPNAPLSVAEQVAIEHAAAAAALCFLQRQAAADVELRLRNDFVWALATGNIASIDEALTRARLLGYDILQPYVGIFGQVDMPEGVERGTVEADRQILTIIGQVARVMQRQVLATSTGGTLLIFLNAPRPDTAAEAFIQRVIEHLAGTLLDITISWGIGTIQSGIENFQRTYQEARAACHIGIRVCRCGQIMHIAQTGGYLLLLNILHDPESAAFRARYLEPLLAYERAKGVPVLQTLETYLETQGNLSETARRLHLHRQSLDYRLKRIEQLTGCRLANPQDRFALDLSLRLYRIYDASESAR